MLGNACSHEYSFRANVRWKVGALSPMPQKEGNHPTILVTPQFRDSQCMFYTNFFRLDAHKQQRSRGLPHMSCTG